MDNLEIKTIKEGRGIIFSAIVHLEILNQQKNKIIEIPNLFILTTKIEVENSINIYIYKESLNQTILNKVNLEKKNIKYRIKDLKILNYHGQTNYIIKKDSSFIRYKSNINKETFTGWILP